MSLYDSLPMPGREDIIPVSMLHPDDTFHDDDYTRGKRAAYREIIRHILEHGHEGMIPAEYRGPVRWDDEDGHELGKHYAYAQVRGRLVSPHPFDCECDPCRVLIIAGAVDEARRHGWS